MKHAVLIQRAARFSPNSVDNDKAILQAVGRRLVEKGYATAWMSEDNWSEQQFSQIQKDVVFTMARSTEVMESLTQAEQSGVRIVNTPAAVRACSRSRLFTMLKRNGMPIPPEHGSNGFWLKRGDEAAQSKGDVVYCADDARLQQAKRQFADRGIADMLVQAHMEGDLVKFYGVADTGFFRVYYPGDDGLTKYGDEHRNGKPHHYACDQHLFRQSAERMATLTGIEVYGGDAIITQSGEWFFIDFNDWPSFSRCREEAAEAITQLLENERR